MHSEEHCADVNMFGARIVIAVLTVVTQRCVCVINLADRQDEAASQGRGVLSLALGFALALQAAGARPSRLADHTSSTTTGLDGNRA